MTSSWEQVEGFGWPGIEALRREDQMVNFHGEADFLDHLGSEGVNARWMKHVCHSQDKHVALSRDKPTYNCAQDPDIIK